MSELGELYDMEGGAMLRLIIADDEKIIRETISTLIDWKSMGIEVVALCASGLEAYDAIMDEFPDIVLTDIKMPDMDGLELIRRVHEIDENIQFVVLSGFGEFKYAAEAMKYGVRHYLLKPCNEKQIEEAMRQVRERILSEGLQTVRREEPEPEKPQHKQFVEQARQYVQAHLDDANLSLKYIAENVLYMNVDYVSKQFVKQTGQKFSDYLNQMRIEKAKQMIENQSVEKMYQVAEAVGLGNHPQYFSQLFKKYTGMTPTAYVKQLQAEGRAAPME